MTWLSEIATLHTQSSLLVAIITEIKTLGLILYDRGRSRHPWMTCVYTFIALFGGSHEDLSHPENSCHPRAKPEGDINFLGGTNLHVSRLTRQLTVYYTESWSTTLYSAERCAVKHDVWRETRRFVFPPRDFSRPIIFLKSSYQLYEV